MTQSISHQVVRDPLQDKICVGRRRKNSIERHCPGIDPLSVWESNTL